MNGNGYEPGRGNSEFDPNAENTNPTAPNDVPFTQPSQASNWFPGLDEGWRTQDGYPQYRGPDGELDPNQNITTPSQLWRDTDSVNYWNTLTAQEIVLLKKTLLVSGYYGSNTPDIRSPLVYQEDVDAVLKAMGDSNANGWGKDKGLVGPTGFLTLARPVREGEGDGSVANEMDKADARTSLKKWLWDNGLALPQDHVRNLVDRIKNDEVSFEDVTQRLTKQYLIPTYPAYAEALKRGETIADLASPYKTQFAELLEVPVEQVDMMDPLMQKAMQGIGEGDRQQSMPLWEFREMLKQDKRWQYTDNAWDEVGGDMAGVMQKWGMM